MTHGELGSGVHSATRGHKSTHMEAQPGEGNPQLLLARALMRPPWRLHERPLAMEWPTQESISHTTRLRGHNRSAIPQENHPDGAVPHMPSSIMQLQLRAPRIAALKVSLT